MIQVLYSGLGGHGSVVTSLIDADASKEWEHCLLFYGTEDLLPAYRSFCETKKIPFSFVQKSKGAFNTGWRQVAKAFASHSPDVIILHSPNLVFPAWLYCRRKKAALFTVEHTPHEAKGIGEKAASFFSLIMSKKVVCLSQEYRSRLHAQFRILPVLKKTEVIPNGIDLDGFRPSVKPASQEISIGMIGRFSHQKNQAMIVEAIRTGLKGTPVHVHFAGTGDTLAGLTELVVQHKLEKQVHFHGLLEGDGIRSFLTTLDIYIHASYAETMCTSVMQAMACGLPVLASDIPGINNIVEAGKNALLFKNDDIAEMLEKLRQLQDAALRKEMGEHARQFAVTHFSARQTFQQYNQMITNHTKR